MSNASWNVIRITLRVLPRFPFNALRAVELSAFNPVGFAILAATTPGAFDFGLLFAVAESFGSLRVFEVLVLRRAKAVSGWGDRRSDVTATAVMGNGLAMTCRSCLWLSTEARDETAPMNESFLPRLQETAARVSAHLDTILQTVDDDNRPPALVEAMRHGALNGGKRLRPFLLIETAALFGVTEEAAMQAACSLECVHCYSLIHDDLPAMDDDDLRRGQPTVHKAFGEATAILAGDALLTLAFELLANNECNRDVSTQMELVFNLARASGGTGMIGGQILDIAAENGELSEQQIRMLQSMKTGALIRFACEAGAVLGGAASEQRKALVLYGEKTGLAFQLADDLLDVTSNSTALGKAAGKDEVRGKGTLVGILGVERARELLNETVTEAIVDLDVFGGEADVLRETSRFVAKRTH